jgi:Flp pilus assembly protein TadB
MLSILISVIGSFVGSRQIHRMSHQIGQIRSKRALLQIFFSIAIILGTLIFLEEPHFLWLFNFLILVSIFWTPSIFVFISKRVFQDSFIDILDQIILGMHSGLNFRCAFKAVIQNESGFIKVQLQDILNQIVFPESSKISKEKSLERIVLEFRETDKSTSKSLEQLKFFRRQLRQEQEFRRKESQIKESVRAQMAILMLLYLALSAFVITRFGFFENKKIILLSLALFVIGLAIINLIGGKRRWKV